MNESGIPLFIMEDRLTEYFTSEVEKYTKQGVPYNSMELILYKVLSHVQSKKSQGYANEYMKLMMANKEEKKDEQSVQ